MESLCRARNKIMYVFSWRTVSAPTRGLFLCLFSSFPTREINTKIILSWALKQFVTRVHTSFSIYWSHSGASRHRMQITISKPKWKFFYSVLKCRYISIFPKIKLSWPGLIIVFFCPMLQCDSVLTTMWCTMHTIGKSESINQRITLPVTSEYM